MSPVSSEPTAVDLGARIAALRDAASTLWDQRFVPSAHSDDSEYVDAVASIVTWLAALHRHGAAREPHVASALEAAVCAAEAVIAAEAKDLASQDEIETLIAEFDDLQETLTTPRHARADPRLIDE